MLLACDRGPCPKVALHLVVHCGDAWHKSQIVAPATGSALEVLAYLQQPMAGPGQPGTVIRISAPCLELYQPAKELERPEPPTAARRPQVPKAVPRVAASQPKAPWEQ